jgi:hypothetical protein
MFLDEGERRGLNDKELLDFAFGTYLSCWPRPTTNEQ